MKRPPASVLWRLAFSAAALLAVFVPLPASAVERFYSNGLYPILQHTLTPAANLLPLAVVDLQLAALLIGLPAWWIVRLKRAGRGNRRRVAGELLWRTMLIAAALTLGFYALWGFNYQRQPLRQKLAFDAQRVNVEALRRFAGVAVANLDEMYEPARGGEWPATEEWRARLLASFNRAIRELGNDRPIAPAMPKRSLMNRFMAATGTTGFVNPYAQEVILEAELLPFEEPFVLAHEWAHLAGYADESEANFVGALACIRADLPAIRYSGWLALYEYASWPAAMSEGETPSLPLPSPPVEADLRAIADRIARNLHPALNEMQTEVYDSFLRANRVEAGIASYGLFVNLMLGIEFEGEWQPRRAASQN